MSNNKQSSIEWLGYELNTSLFYDLSPKLWKQVDNLFKQAIEMHKQEIEDAFSSGGDNEWFINKRVKKKPQQYYNQTFGGNNEQ